MSNNRKPTSNFEDYYIEYLKYLELRFWIEERVKNTELKFVKKFDWNRLDRIGRTRRKGGLRIA